MKFKNLKQCLQTAAIWASLGQILILLASCRSLSKTIKVDGEITPDPIVGEIVTLTIETLSPKESGEGVFYLYYNKEINFLEMPPEWYEPAEDRGAESLEWRGPVVAGEPSVHEFTLCVTKPGNWGIHIGAGVGGKEFGENTLHIIGTADSAQVIPSSKYGGSWTPPPKRTPILTPEPVQVSPECAGT